MKIVFCISSGRPRYTERKTPPKPGQVILHTDGSNLIQWLEAMHRHLQKKYGMNGRFIETKELYVRDVPSVNLLTAKHGDTLTNAQIKDMHATYVTNYAKLHDRDISEYVSMFGVIFECLSDEGSEMVREHKDWSDTNRENNPLKLINIIIIKNVHSLRLQNIDNAEAQYIAMQKYQNIRQVPGMSMTEYRNAFDQTIADLTVLNHNTY